MIKWLKHERIPYRNDRYKRFIRDQECVGCRRPAEPHHTETWGTSKKCSDYRTIPLCRDCHDNAHRPGEPAFDVDKVVIALLEAFIESERSDVSDENR